MLAMEMAADMVYARTSMVVTRLGPMCDSQKV